MLKLPAVIVLACISSIAWAEYPEPGLYSVTASVRVGDMEMPGKQHENCLTAEDMAPENFAVDDAGNCQVLERSMADGKIILRMTCEEQGMAMTMKGDGTYDASNIIINTQATMGSVIVNGSVISKRIGECR